jgi:hypothetical protein
VCNELGTLKDYYNNMCENIGELELKLAAGFGAQNFDCKAAAAGAVPTVTVHMREGQTGRFAISYMRNYVNGGSPTLYRSILQVPTALPPGIAFQANNQNQLLVTVTGGSTGSVVLRAPSATTTPGSALQVQVQNLDPRESSITVSVDWRVPLLSPPLCMSTGGFRAFAPRRSIDTYPCAPPAGEQAVLKLLYPPSIITATTSTLYGKDSTVRVQLIGESQGMASAITLFATRQGNTHSLSLPLPPSLPLSLCNTIVTPL